MTLVDLLDYCEKQSGEFGLSFVTLVIPRRKRGPWGGRMRVLPGVMGRVLGHAQGEKPGTIVSVAIADVKSAIVRRLEDIEANALHFAERGEHDKADEWMQQFITLRDRLGGRAFKPSRAPRSRAATTKG